LRAAAKRPGRYLGGRYPRRPEPSCRHPRYVDRDVAKRARGGIRPFGEAEAAGRPLRRRPGIWWVWIPLKFGTILPCTSCGRRTATASDVNYAVAGLAEAPRPQDGAARLARYRTSAIPLRTPQSEGATCTYTATRRHASTTSRSMPHRHLPLPFRLRPHTALRLLEPTEMGDVRVLDHNGRPLTSPTRDRGPHPLAATDPPGRATTLDGAEHGFGFSKHGTVGRHLPTSYRTGGVAP